LLSRTTLLLELILVRKRVFSGKMNQLDAEGLCKGISQEGDAHQISPTIISQKGKTEGSFLEPQNGKTSYKRNRAVEHDWALRKGQKKAGDGELIKRHLLKGAMWDKV